MFVVVNKDKIISYIVSVSTVATLFIMPYVISKNKNEVIPTSSNTIMVNKIENNNYNERSELVDMD